MNKNMLHKFIIICILFIFYEKNYIELLEVTSRRY